MKQQNRKGTQCAYLCSTIYTNGRFKRLRHYFGVFFLLITFLALSTNAWADYAHKSGNSGRAMQDNGYGIMMQGVHTERVIVYMPTTNGATKSLVLPEKSFRYSRWYNYRTDATITNANSNGTIGFDYISHVLRDEDNRYASLTNSKGVYRNGNNGSEYKPALTVRWDSRLAKDAIFTMANGVTQTSGKIAEVACDLSNYNDHTLTGSNQVEPTLSVRMIYEIHPAAEMAAMLTKCTGNTYLEEYTIVAPVGRTVLIGPKYEYQGTNSNYYTSATSRVSSATWSGGSVGSVQNNRVVSVSSNSATTVTYTLKSGNYNIARFKVIYKAVTEVGPSNVQLIPDSVLLKDYQYVTGLNFDGDQNVPLEWDETTYGFFYPNMSGQRGVSNATYFGEYEMMNMANYKHTKAGTRDVLYKKSGNTNGNFLYVDAGSTPGVVANLRFKESGLCPGMRMYVSAWVNNVGTDTKPNLNFSIIGIKGGVESVLSTYTTGDLETGTDQGVWKHIFFEIQMPQIEYDDYRLRVVNNAQNTKGNDFGIDEIVIYMQKPALMLYQADVACPDANGNDKGEVVMVRMDPDGFDFEGDADTLFYQFQELSGAVLNLKDYNREGIALGTNYGIVKLAKTGKKTDYIEYSSLEAYKIAAAGQANISNIFIVKEADEKGVFHDIYYIMHNDTSKFKVGNSYQCVLSSTVADLNSATSNCGMNANFNMQPQAKVVLNGSTSSDLYADSDCGNSLNTIAIVLYGSESELGQLFEGVARYDWLNGDEAAYGPQGEYYGFNYQTIKDAIMAMRIEFPNASLLSDLSAKGSFTADDLNLITQLMTRGMLELNQSEIKRYFTQDSTYYTVFPIAGSAVNSTNKQIRICDRPFVILIAANFSDSHFVIGSNSENHLPDHVKLRRQVRINSANLFPTVGGVVQSLALPIREITPVQSATALNNKVKVYLLNSSSDGNSSLPFYDGNSSAPAFGLVTFVENNGQGYMSLETPHASLKFKPGHRYDFVAVLDPLDGEVCSGYCNFSIVVIPERVMWSPVTASTSWHRDNNWVMIDADGNIDDSGVGYVPDAYTNALIAVNVQMPILINPEAKRNADNSVSYYALGDAAQIDIMFDYNFLPNSCKNVHIGANAVLGNHQWLNYQKAWVDVALTAGQWNLFAPPFEGMVTGDMHIPASGSYQSGYFEDVDAPDNRGIYRFYTSMFNSESYTVDRNNDTTMVSGTEWTAPFNALNQPIIAGHGYSIWPQNNRDAETTLVVRLPKADTEYYYYGTYGEQTNIKENVTRPANYGRLAGSKPVGAAVDANVDATAVVRADFSMRKDVTQSVHLVANPFMTELDVNKFFQHADNSNTATGTYSLFNPADRSQVSYNINSGSGSGGGTIVNIPPMTSFLVQIDPEWTNPVLNIYSSMMTTYSGGSAPAPSAVRSALSSAPKSQLVIEANRNGVTSYCSVIESDVYTSGYDMYEDSRLIMLSSAMTPSAIYTHTDHEALVINGVSEMDMIPLGISIIDNEPTTHLTLTFNGVSDFNGHVMLYDAKSGARQSLVNGITISLPELANDNSRYYIRYIPQAPTELENTLEDGVVKVYQPEHGQVVVASSNYIQTIRVYSVNGQLIMERGSLNSLQEELQLTTGVYVVDVTTESGVSREKVIIR